MRTKELFAVALWLMLPSLPAQAQSDLERADELFMLGEHARGEGDWGRACQAYRSSQALDPSASTQARIAQCLERDRKLVGALEAYRVALDLIARHDTNPALQQRLGAQIPRDIARVEAALPTLHLRVGPAGARAELLLDGHPLRYDDAEAGLRVDPGQHELVVSAEGFSSERRLFSLTEGARIELSLQLSPDAVAGAPRAPVMVRAKGTAVHTEAEADSAPSRGSMWKASGWGLSGVGVTLLGVGAYFGIRTLSLVSDADCGADDACSPKGAQDLEDAGDAQRLGLILAATGTAALAGGVTLLLTAPTSSSSVSVRLGPGAVFAGGSW